MARSDLVVSLVRASALGDQKTIKNTVEALVAEEHSKNHHLLAEKIWSVYQLARNKVSDNKNSPSSSHGSEQSSQGELRFNAASSDISELLHELNPIHGLSELFLDDIVQSNCNELIEEQLASDLLRSYATEPRNRIVLTGPPGNGKTSLARAIAYELGLPLYVLKYEAIFGSFLGETSGRLKRVFDFVRSRPCVIFFDEFDTLGKERGDAHETGEIKRVVSTLLLQIDDLPTHNVIIAAWRRFQIRVELLPPDPQQIQLMLRSLEKHLQSELDIEYDVLTNYLKGLSYSDIEQFLLDVKRRWILLKNPTSLKPLIMERLNLLKHRFNTKIATNKNGKSSATSVT
jgi:SpoVK/Ycf46/Vps4 family AAA+-type ATPase